MIVVVYFSSFDPRLKLFYGIMCVLRTGFCMLRMDLSEVALSFRVHWHGQAQAPCVSNSTCPTDLPCIITRDQHSVTTVDLFYMVF